MEIALLKSSFSIIVKEGRDCATALFNSQGQTIAQAISVPIHLGALMESLPQILRKFPVEQMQDGDVYLANDPFSGGTHLPDITVVVPVVYRSDVVALTASMVHHQDIGAMVPGTPTSSTSIYQEGLNLPPLKFYDRRKPVQVVHDIIRNNVRIPDTIIGDLRAQVAAGYLGSNRFIEFIEEYSKDVVLIGMNQLLDRAEILTRQELGKMPEGSYSFHDYLDNDGINLEQPIKISVTVTIRGGEFIADFTGSSAQVKGPFNSPSSGAYSAACSLIKILTEGENISSNAGAFKPIAVNLPEGSIVNPQPPAAVAARASTISRCADVLKGAMVNCARGRLPACGFSQAAVVYFGGTDPMTGDNYVWTDIAVGGSGGRPNKDGIDTIWQDMVNGYNIPVETIESRFPQRIIKTKLICDSAGAGEYRGGLGMERVWENLRGEVSVTYRGERHYVGPWGLFGGHAGSLSKAFITRRTGEIEHIASKRDFVLYEGDSLHAFTSGGGGFGDPLNRKPELVLDDIIDKKVSLSVALKDYGVVIDKESMQIDFNKTNELRIERKRLKNSFIKTYDRGKDLCEEEGN
jgi:N-methylhydantoinase B